MKKQIATTFAVLTLFALSAFAQGDMVFVEGGSFIMGNDSGNADERPAHPVKLDSFYMGKYKVTLADWANVIGKWPVDYKAAFIWNSPLPREQWNQIPAFGISWNDAIIYCNRLSVLEGLEPCYASNGSKDAVTFARFSRGSKAVQTSAGGKIKNVSCDWSANGYRLPTEAEWEYAARGGKNKSPYKYSGSNSYGEVVNSEMPYKIGQKKPNALGIHDMSMGPEWCWDYYAKSYAGVKESANPRGIDSWDELNRVLRGGAYNGESPEDTSMVYSRYSDKADKFEIIVGPVEYMFRVVRNAEGYSSKKNVIVRQNVEVKITGVPYTHFMTDDYDALRVALLQYNCRAPAASELKENPTLAKPVLNKMKELGVCWSFNGNILNYYTPEEGAYSVYLKDLEIQQ